MKEKPVYELIKKNVLAFGIFFIYSLSSVFSKIAGTSQFGSLKFIVCYMGVIGVMGIYALIWQQMLKKYPLSDIFLYKSTTIIWGSFFGWILFQETISLKKWAGILLIVIGIYLINQKEK